MLVERPAAGEKPIDDVNWFARPVPNRAGRWIIAFASHHQNYLYDLTTGARIKIPDRSDAVATPDGNYLTVPSNYTPDGYVRFYALAPLLEALARGEDADRRAPAFIHEHPDLRKVYYQSVGVVSSEPLPGGENTVYRMMFSGTGDGKIFRMVDYAFRKDASGLHVSAGEPMELCPEITNDLQTPFISKDGRYIVSYTSPRPGREYVAGASLKIFEITRVDAGRRVSHCVERVDLGFPAGKADFSYDGNELVFHTSKTEYLTAFINGGIPTPSITDVVVVRLTRDRAGRLDGHRGVARVTTSQREGIGSYFPAFFPDGKIFYVANRTPKDRAGEKRFFFRVVDPAKELYLANVFTDARHLENAVSIGRLWEDACASGWVGKLTPYEAPWYFMSLSAEQCRVLVEDRFRGPAPARNALLQTCRLLEGL